MSEVFKKFLQLIKPINSYDETDHPKAPDYSNLDSWAAHPDIDGYQFFVPDNKQLVSLKLTDLGIDGNKVSYSFSGIIYPITYAQIILLMKELR